MSAWLWAFAFTQAVEVPVYLFALARDGRARPLWARFVIAFGASALTHPPLWFFGPRAWVWLYLSTLSVAPWVQLRSPTARYIVYVVIAESLVILAEGLLLYALRTRRAWRWALVANVASVALGLSCRALFGVP